MFDFAISRNQRRRPTKRLFASWVISCIVHFGFILLLIQFPELLRGGMYHRFRPLSVITNLFGSPVEDDDKNWRTVTVLRTPMIEPSAATLRKYLKDWSEKGPEAPPIRIRLGNEQKKALENAPPVPRVPQESKATTVFPPPREGTGVGSTAGNSAESSPGSSAIAQVEPNTGRRGTISLPPPASPPKTEAGNAAPSAIPDGVKQPPNSATSKDSLKVFEDEQKAIRSPGSGFFDTKGFPLGDYVDIIKERIKGNWFIPSHLKNSQGHTTIVFYIGKDGRFSNARIEASASSGNSSLDLAALKAIIDSNPFPPLPKGFPGDHVGAKFVLSYNEGNN